MRRRSEIDDQQVDVALEQLWRRLPAPPDDDLHAIAAAASAEARRPDPSGRDARRRWTHLGRGWALGLAGATLLIGSALGFGLGNSLTPSGSATSLVGFGFLPAQGWNVVQSGTLDATGVAQAMAANVPLDPRDDLIGEPRATLRMLPPGGMVISAMFRPRGDAAMDATFPSRKAPLRVEAAEPIGAGRYVLRAGIRGYNVTLTFHFGSVAPTTQTRAAVQRQLDRLVVAAERVTMFARPTIATGRNWINLFGSIASGKAGESVAIQAKDCGTDSFRLVAGATTQSGGTWSWRYGPSISTTLRAVWDDSASPEIRIGRRAFVEIEKQGQRRFVVTATGLRSPFWRKKVTIQERDRRLGTWKSLKTVVLTDPGTYGSQSSATFRLSRPRGTLIRAVLPLSQTKPCYLAGTSEPIRS